MSLLFLVVVNLLAFGVLEVLSYKLTHPSLPPTPMSLKSMIDEGIISITNLQNYSNGNSSWELVVLPPYDKVVRQVIREDARGKFAYIEGFGQSMRIRW